MIRFAAGTKPPAKQTNRRSSKAGSKDRSVRTTLSSLTSHRASTTPHSPSHLAKESTVTTVTSLHESFQPNAENYVVKLLKLLAQEHRFIEKAKTLSNETFMPRSIRFQFKLLGSPSVVDSPNFTTLCGTASAAITDCQTKLKDVIIQRTNMELQSVRHRTIQLTVKGTAFLAKMFMESKKLDISDLKCFYFFHYALNVPGFTRQLLNIDKVLTDYYDQIDLLLPTRNSDNEPPEYTPAHREFKNIIDKLFFNSRVEFSEAIAQQKLNTHLATAARLHSSEKATTDAVIALDDEPSVDAPTLRKLIETQVVERTSALTRDLKKVTAMVRQAGLQALQVKSKPEKPSNQNSDRNNGSKNNRNRQASKPKSQKRDNTTAKNNSGSRGKNDDSSISDNDSPNPRKKRNTNRSHKNKKSDGKPMAKNESRGVPNTSRNTNSNASTSTDNPNNANKSKKRNRNRKQNQTDDTTDDRDSGTSNPKRGSGNKSAKKRRLGTSGNA
jgi:DNA-binding transcriptional MerR regulator